VFTARYGLNLRVMYINPSKPSGHCMYRQLNIQQFCVAPTQCIYVLCGELRVIISLYSINWLVFIIETECVYCAVRSGSLNHKQLLFPYTALTVILLTWRIWRAPNNASKWQMGFNSAFLRVNREAVCLLCGTDWIYKYSSCYLSSF